MVLDGLAAHKRQLVGSLMSRADEMDCRGLMAAVFTAISAPLCSRFGAQISSNQVQSQDGWKETITSQRGQKVMQMCHARCRVGLLLLLLAEPLPFKRQGG